MFTKVIELFTAISRKYGLNKKLVNIGAHDGIFADDPCYDLHRLLGFGGIAIDKSNYEKRCENLKGFPVVNINRYVTPDNIQGILEENDIPQTFDFLKIDIDSFDGQLMETILEKDYHPLAICIEINPEFPPPVQFCMQYSPEIQEAGSVVKFGLYGCSVTYAAHLAACFGYSPWHLTFGEISCVQDMIFVRDDILEKCKLKSIDVAAEYYRCRFAPTHLLSKAGIDALEWRKIYDHDLRLEEIYQAIKSIKGFDYKYTLE